LRPVGKWPGKAIESKLTSNRHRLTNLNLSHFPCPVGQSQSSNTSTAAAPTRQCDPPSHTTCFSVSVLPDSAAFTGALSVCYTDSADSEPYPPLQHDLPCRLGHQFSSPPRPPVTRPLICCTDSDSRAHTYHHRMPPLQHNLLC
jgi:hypothetical protein